MGKRHRAWALAVLAAAVMGAGVSRAAENTHWDFVCTNVRDVQGASVTQVKPAEMPYSRERGFGFESTAGITTTTDGSLTSNKPFFFSVDVPEGNYRVTVTLGDKQEAGDTTVKAELRRLFVEKVKTAAGEQVKKSFIVNVRLPAYPGGAVRLKGDREKNQEAWAWDDRITLEFNGTKPTVSQITIDKVDVPTVYILGDSTSCDQSREPYASWGQMVTRFFKDDIAIANHGESGESVGASNGAKRFDKILSEIKPGDFFMTQFGHNDMKGTDASVYKEGLKKWAAAIKAKGATAIIVTPVARHKFRDGKATNSLANDRGDFVQAAKDAAKESGALLLDLNGLSSTMYDALGEEPSLALFEHQGSPLKYDETHHSPYGAYEVAKCVVEGVRAGVPELAKHVAEDYKPFDPAKPDKEADFDVPPTPLVTTEKPFGN